MSQFWFSLFRNFGLRTITSSKNRVFSTQKETNNTSTNSKKFFRVGLGLLSSGIIGIGGISWACLYTNLIIENDAILSYRYLPMHFVRFYRTLTTVQSRN